MHSDVAIIVPSFNEQSRILETITQLNSYFSNIFIVDDGSQDNTYNLIQELGVFAIKHPINLGQGAAIQTGIELALKQNGINYFVTFDADGQHSIQSAIDLVSEIKKNEVDVILGSRFINKLHSSSVPQKKKFILKLGIIFTRFDTGLKVTDTHNGLRAMNRKFCESIAIKQNGMAHASEILRQIREGNFSWKEYPVSVIYTDYSKAKGQSILNAINIVTEMLHR